MPHQIFRAICIVMGIFITVSGSYSRSTFRTGEINQSGVARAKEDGTFDSLKEAVRNARRRSKQTDTARGDYADLRSERLTAADGVAGDEFGISVAIDGNTAIVGAYVDDVGSNVDQGSAYIFVRRGTAWEQEAQLIASGGAAGDQFGIGVSISGNTVIVGAAGSNMLQGAAYIFVRSGAAWTQQTRLNASDGEQGDQFGRSVSVSGESAVVGAYADDIGPQTDRGSAYVFVRSGTIWSQQEHLFGIYDRPRDYFGYSVGISGETVIAGVFLADVGSNINQGSAYIFVRNGTVWSQQAYLTASDAATNDRFGTSVAIDKNTVIVGAFLDTIGSNLAQGSAYVFVRNNTSWAEQARLVAADGAANDSFGVSVGISDDNAIVGADRSDSGTNIDHGSAYVFVRIGTAWNQRSKLTGSADAANANFGSSVAISGASLIAGVPGDTIGSNLSQGSAFIYDLGRIATFCDFDGDGRADLSVFRPGENFWYINYSSDGGLYPMRWGLDTDYLMPGDFDGDGKADISVWREGPGPGNAYCYIFNSSDGTVRFEQFGEQWDVLAVGDWDGDGIDDPAVYRDSAFGSQGYFFYNGSANNPNGYITYVPWGVTGDRAVRGDFDGDGKQDAAVFRPSTALWYIRQSSDGTARYESWGISTDVFVPADYDGDGRTDTAVFRNGVWYIRRSSDGQIGHTVFGLSTDAAVPADYDGDGRADLGVFRNGMWYYIRSSDSQFTAVHWGISADRPVPAAYLQ